jgi:D-arabinose 5-phosphate isomerase GutQ
MIWDLMRSRDQDILRTTVREENVIATNADATVRVKAKRKLVSRKLVSKGGTL